MLSREKPEHLELLCPKCEGSTKVKTEEGVQCKQCEASFKGMSFNQKKIFRKSSAYMIVVGAIGGVVLDNTIEDARLPYAAEYKLMDTCLGVQSSMVDAYKYSERVDICACAVRRAVNNLGVGRDRNEPDEVLDAFSREIRHAAQEC